MRKIGKQAHFSVYMPCALLRNSVGKRICQLPFFVSSHFYITNPLFNSQILKTDPIWHPVSKYLKHSFR